LAVYRKPNEVIDSLERRNRVSWKTKRNYSTGRTYLHRLCWRPYQSWERKNWIKSWVNYNSSIIEFESNYPEDIIVIKLEDLLVNWYSLLEKINSLTHLNLKPVDIEEVYKKDLLSSETPQKTYLNFQEVNRTVDKLNEISIRWT
jgi:hypothetical protein